MGKLSGIVNSVMGVPFHSAASMISPAPGAAERALIFRLIAQDCRDAILVVAADPANRSTPGIVYANRAFERMTGYAAAEILGESPSFLQDSHPEGTFSDRISQAIREHAQVCETLLGYRKDGSPFRVELDVKPVGDDAETCTHFIVALRDVPEVKRQEASSAKTLAHVPGAAYQFQRSPDGLMCFPFAAPQLEAILGVTPGEVRDDAFAAFYNVHPDDLAGVCDAISASAETMSVWRFSFRSIHRDGRTVMVRGEASPEAMLDGSVLWHGYMADATGDYEAAAALRLAKAVVDNNSQAIMITDAGNRIVSVNAAFEAVTGYPAAEVIGLDPRFLASDNQDKAFYRSMWGSLLANNSWSGEIVGRRKSGELYSEWLEMSVIRDADHHIVNYVAMFADITERKASAKWIRSLAFFDTLTGLPNRRLAEDRLEGLLGHAAQTGQAAALIFLDLDLFKVVNETFGHKTGDDVLREVAGRLARVVPADEVLARLGGDEFVVGFAGLDGPEMAMHRAQSILEALVDPVIVDGREFHISASLGVAMYPNDARDLLSLMQYADQAMYVAKRGGRGDFRFFSPKMHSDAVKRTEREAALRQAVANEAFDFVFQPQVDLKTGQAIAAETLIRARDPSLGGPAEFVPLAEEIGLIHAIGDLSLRAACRQASYWRNTGSAIQRVAVNVSALQFSDPQFVHKIAAAVKAEGLPPEAIEIEITETAAMADAARTITVLTQLHSLGVETAIDDFGTGYSSLAYLRNFPLNRIKIDRAFTAGIEHNRADIELVRAVVSLAHSLGLDTLAEGVETAGQEALLRDLGCAMAQGYLFGKPRREEAFDGGAVLPFVPRQVPEPRTSVAKAAAANSPEHSMTPDGLDGCLHAHNLLWVKLKEAIGQ